MQFADILSIAGLRLDGRKSDELRHMRCRLGVEQNCDGSAYFEQGLNKVLVTVHGPQEPQKRSEMQNEEATIICRVNNVPYSGMDRKEKRTADRRTLEMELLLRQTLEAVVLIDLYPKTEIVINVHILESDGSVICIILNAISLALMHAGISCSDMLVACSAGLVKHQQCQDLTQLEQTSSIYLPLAIKAHSEEILYFQVDQRISEAALQDLLQAGIDGCRSVRSFLENAIKAYMVETKAGM